MRWHGVVFNAATVSPPRATHQVQPQAYISQAGEEELPNGQAKGTSVRKPAHRQAQQPTQGAITALSGHRSCAELVVWHAGAYKALAAGAGGSNWRQLHLRQEGKLADV